MSSVNKTARPQNAHLRRVNSAFSGFAGLKLHLFLQPHDKVGVANLLFSHPHDRENREFKEVKETKEQTLYSPYSLNSLTATLISTATQFVVRRG